MASQDLSGNFERYSSGKILSVIINQIQFEFDEESGELERFSIRQGAEVDGKRLIDTFNKLNAEVIEKNNILNKTEFEIFLTSVCEKLNKTQYYGLVLFINSHGDQKDGYDLIQCKQFKQYITTKNIMSFFENCNCSGLVNKPKIFFFNACRGEESNTSAIETCGHNLKRDHVGGSTYTDTTKKDASFRSSDYAKLHSTVPDYISNRNVNEGSSFVQACCDIIDQHASNWDLQHMVKLIIAQCKKPPKDELDFDSQVPEFTHCLLKDFYFPVKQQGMLFKFTLHFTF